MLLISDLDLELEGGSLSKKERELNKLGKNISINIKSPENIFAFIKYHLVVIEKVDQFFNLLRKILGIEVEKYSKLLEKPDDDILREISSDIFEIMKVLNEMLYKNCLQFLLLYSHHFLQCRIHVHCMLL